MHKNCIAIRQFMKNIFYKFNFLSISFAISSISSYAERTSDFIFFNVDSKFLALNEYLLSRLPPEVVADVAEAEQVIIILKIK